MKDKGYVESQEIKATIELYMQEGSSYANMNIRREWFTELQKVQNSKTQRIYAKQNKTINRNEWSEKELTDANDNHAQRLVFSDALLSYNKHFVVHSAEA